MILGKSINDFGANAKRSLHIVGLTFFISLTAGCGVMLLGQKVAHPVSVLDGMLRRDSVIVEPNRLAAELAKAGDGTVLLVKNGTYKDINLSLTKNNSYKVLIKPQTDGGVIFTGESSIRVWGTQNLALNGFHFQRIKSKDVIVLHKTRHVEVSNNYFEECGNNAIGSIIRLETEASYNNIHHNTLEGNRSMGITITASPENPVQCTNNFMHNNHFSHIVKVSEIYPGQNNGLEAIQLGQGIEDAKLKLHTHIYDNYFEDIIGDGSEIISVKTSENYIYNNSFLNNKSGITLRFGNSNEIYDNYFENTSQGIRVFGYGHIIKDNVIQNGEIAIQLPASNFRNNERTSSSGYFQQENVNIKGNVIVNPRTAAFSIGRFRSTNGGRTLMPRNVSIIDNQIVLNNSSAQEYQSDDDEAVRNLKLDRNKRVSNVSEVTGKASRSAGVNRRSMLNSRVGASWRKIRENK